MLHLRIGKRNLRPHPFGGGTVSWSTQIPHSPDTRPKPTVHRLTRHTCRKLKVSMFIEAKLIPGLEHARLEVEIVDGFLCHGDDQMTVGRCHSRGIKPFEISTLSAGSDCGLRLTQWANSEYPCQSKRDHLLQRRSFHPC